VSRFKVQLGRDQGSYRTVLSTDNAAQASIVFNGYNVGRGYKKRLLDNGKVHARVLTHRWE
jgi:hypothetical protein